MNLTDILESSEHVKPFRMLLYGVAGIGKSTFAAAAPDPLFVQTEDGLVEMNVMKTKLCTSFRQFLEYLALARQAKDAAKIKSIVVDSLDWMEELMTQEVLRSPEAINKGYKKLSDWPYGAGGQLLRVKALEVLNALKELYYTGLNIILIAHTKPEKIVNPDGTDYDQHSPRLNKNVNPIFKEWVDIIGFCNFDFVVKETKGEFNRTVTKAVETKNGVRSIMLTGSPSVVAKCRYRNLPDKMPLNGKMFFDNLLNKQQTQGEQPNV